MMNYRCVSEGGVGRGFFRLHSPRHNVSIILRMVQIAQSTDGPDQQNKEDICWSWDMIERSMRVCSCIMGNGLVYRSIRWLTEVRHWQTLPHLTSHTYRSNPNVPVSYITFMPTSSSTPHVLHVFQVPKSTDAAIQAKRNRLQIESMLFHLSEGYRSGWRGMFCASQHITWFLQILDKNEYMLTPKWKVCATITGFYQIQIAIDRHLKKNKKKTNLLLQH